MVVEQLERWAEERARIAEVDRQSAGEVVRRSDRRVEAGVGLADIAVVPAER